MRSNTSRHRRWAGLAGMALVVLSAVVSIGAVVGTAAAGIGYQQTATVEVGATISVPPSPTPSRAPVKAEKHPAGETAVPSASPATAPRSTAGSPAVERQADVTEPSREDDRGPAPESVQTAPAETAGTPSPDPAVSGTETPAL